MHSQTLEYEENKYLQHRLVYITCVGPYNQLSLSATNRLEYDKELPVSFDQRFYDKCQSSYSKHLWKRRELALSLTRISTK